MRNYFNMTLLKELIGKGASVEVYDNNYNTTSLFEMANAAEKAGAQLKIHIRNSEPEDLYKILEKAKNSVTFIFD